MGNEQRRAALTRIWLAAVVAWSLVRLWIVRRMLGRYGVNAWVYGAVDLALAWPYAMASARLVTSLVDRQIAAARKWAAVTAVTFIVPDVYLVLSGHRKPHVVSLTIVVVATAMALASVASMGKEVRSRRINAPAVPAT